MLLPGIHGQLLQYCSVWALFIWILFHILKQTMFEEDVVTIGEEE